ncbi:MAG: hypothetical protein AAF467_06180 [Actinomycetota bacterium]
MIRRSARALSALMALPMVLLLALPASPAAAETPGEVLEEITLDGVYIARARDGFDEPALANTVREARARGIRLVVVAPTDPQPSATAFARRVLEAADADVSIVFAEDGRVEAFVIDELQSAQFRAVDAARSKADPTVAVEAFVDELLAEPDRGLPPIVNQLLRLVVVLALLLTLAVVAEQLLRRWLRSRRRAAAARKAARKTAVSSAGGRDLSV